MKNLENIMLIEFKDYGLEQVAVFDKTKISESEVKKFVAQQYPIGFDERILFTSKKQWMSVFGQYSSIERSESK